jgi:hypothetical protein
MGGSFSGIRRRNEEGQRANSTKNLKKLKLKKVNKKQAKETTTIESSLLLLLPPIPI